VTRVPGRYRVEARRLMQEALAALPPAASCRDRHRACLAVRPGRYDGGWPNHCWLREQRALLLAPSPTATPPPRVRVGPHGVSCDWCGKPADPRPHGCLACAGARRLLLRARESGTPDLARWAAWLNELEADPADVAGRAALADWLEEEGGFSEEAKHLREGSLPPKE
jgi:hypothetical protein